MHGVAESHPTIVGLVDHQVLPTSESKQYDDLLSNKDSPVLAHVDLKDDDFGCQWVKDCLEGHQNGLAWWPMQAFCTF